MTTEADVKTLLRRLDAAFTEGRFDEIGAEMDGLDVGAMDPTLVVVWLSITYPATHYLGVARESLVARARVRLEATIGVDRTTNILSRLG